MMNPAQRVFLLLLNNARNGTECTARFYEEISHYAPYADIKSALQARASNAKQTLAVLDECSHLTGTEPVRVRSRFEEAFADDFRRGLIEIQSPAATALYILAKATHLQDLRSGEYMTLAAVADVTGHPEIAMLLERCLADHETSDLTRQIIQDVLRERISRRVVA